MSRQLALLIFALAGGMALIGQLLVLRDLFAGQTPAANTSLASRARETLWIVIPAIALVVLLIATYRALPAGTASMTPVAATAGD